MFKFLDFGSFNSREKINLQKIIMTTKLKFYYDLKSQPSRVLYILLNASKVPFEDHTVALQNGR